MRIIKSIQGRAYSIFERKQSVKFYNQFISKNDLVFDIGANHGNRTIVFLDIGANIVSVEPNPKLAKKLVKKFGDRIEVIQKAIGKSNGKIDLYINDADVLSTTSKTWIDAIKNTDRFGDYINQFNTKIEVELLTLDVLFKQYGVPSFMKIDTEGLELEIIKSLINNQVNILSFEFAIPESFDDTIMAINHLDSIGYKGFKISFSESMEFLVSEYLSKYALIKLLENLPRMSWGDIYAFSK